MVSTAHALLYALRVFAVNSLATNYLEQFREQNSIICNLLMNEVSLSTVLKLYGSRFYAFSMAILVYTVYKKLPLKKIIIMQMYNLSSRDINRMTDDLFVLFFFSLGMQIAEYFNMFLKGF